MKRKIKKKFNKLRKRFDSYALNQLLENIENFKMETTDYEIQLIEELSNTPVEVSFDIDTGSLNIYPNPDIFIPIKQTYSDYMLNIIGEVFQKIFCPNRVRRIISRYECAAITQQTLREISYLINVSDEHGLHDWQNTFKEEVKKKLNINT